MLLHLSEHKVGAVATEVFLIGTDRGQQIHVALLCGGGDNRAFWIDPVFVLVPEEEFAGGDYII